MVSITIGNYTRWVSSPITSRHSGLAKRINAKLDDERRGKKRYWRSDVKKQEVEYLATLHRPCNNPFLAPPLPDGFEPQQNHHIRALRHLAEGGQGEIWLVEISSKPLSRRRQGNQRQLHVIKMKQSDHEPMIYHDSEVANLLKLGSCHCNIVQLEGWTDTELKYSFIYYEYCDAGDIKRFMEGDPDEDWTDVPEAFVWHVFKELTQAIDFLHNPPEGDNRDPLLHLDIKPENVFLTWTSDDHKQYPRVKLGDFGCSLSVPPNKGLQLKSERGTPVYKSPEAVSGPGRSSKVFRKSDVWGVGVVVYHMCDRAPPPANESQNMYDECSASDSSAHERKIERINERAAIECAQANEKTKTRQQRIKEGKRPTPTELQKISNHSNGDDKVNIHWDNEIIKEESLQQDLEQTNRLEAIKKPRKIEPGLGFSQALSDLIMETLVADRTKRIDTSTLLARVIKEEQDRRESLFRPLSEWAQQVHWENMRELDLIPARQGDEENPIVIDDNEPDAPEDELEVGASKKGHRAKSEAIDADMLKTKFKKQKGRGKSKVTATGEPTQDHSKKRLRGRPDAVDTEEPAPKSSKKKAQRKSDVIENDEPNAEPIAKRLRFKAIQDEKPVPEPSKKKAATEKPSKKKHKGKKA